MRYQVIEDNGGGLHLYIFDRNKCIYAHSGYEYSPGQLSQDISALMEGEDPRQWEGGEENPEEEYLSWVDGNPYGWQTIARGNENGISYYPHRMGRAAQLEFKIKNE
jgi:hypothetical protein